MDKVSVGCLVYLIVVYAMIEVIKRTKLDSIHLNGYTKDIFRRVYQNSTLQ